MLIYLKMAGSSFLNRYFSLYLLLLVLSVSQVLHASEVSSPSESDSLAKIRERGVLLWGSDAEGGAPYVFPDSTDPSKLVGFEVDIADAVARRLGVKARQVQNAWDSLIPALERGDFDIAMNGIEITPQREKRLLFSIPYYIYTEQLVVRKDDARINSIEDLKGMKVGTISGAVAQDILLKMWGNDIVLSYGQADPYEDLALGRLDAVFQDLPIAAYYAKPDQRLRYAGPPVGEGFYGIAIRKDNQGLKEAIDRILGELLSSGEIEGIYRKWDMWNDAQAKLFLEKPVVNEDINQRLDKDVPLSRFFGSLLKGAGMTVLLSVVSMSLAVALGLMLAISRIYGTGLMRFAAVSYIEIYRGTPLLIQLYILYYGLPNLGITMSPLVAGITGLAMNYAAYEAEIYRAGIEAISKGQMEAALALGMRRSLAVRRIILPQAFSISLPAVTNDFIALFKDSSLVSVIALVELTKMYSIVAASTLRFLELGLITAILYFAMSYPLSLLARRLEKRLKGKR